MKPLAKHLPAMRKANLLALLNPGPAPHYAVTLDVEVEREDPQPVLDAWLRRYQQALPILRRRDRDTRPCRVLLEDLDGLGMHLSPPGHRRLRAQVEIIRPDGPTGAHRGIQQA